jgi:predicted Rossmann fold nucleotide-binding protein DprA/Smf involved in DNA uptake
MANISTTNATIVTEENIEEKVVDALDTQVEIQQLATPVVNPHLVSTKAHNVTLRKGKDQDRRFFAIGDESIASGRLVHIILTKKYESFGELRTQRACAWLETEGYTLLSGGLRKEDLIAINEFLKMGGKVVIVLPQGFGTIRREVWNELKEYIEAGQMLLLSRFQWRENWSMERAKERNLHMAWLADAVVVSQCVSSQSAETHTWGGGGVSMIEAALAYQKPVFLPSLIKADQEVHQFIAKAQGVTMLPAVASIDETFQPLKETVPPPVEEPVWGEKEQAEAERRLDGYNTEE